MSKLLKYVGPMPAVVLFDGREVQRGATFAVDDDTVADNLLGQTDNYAPADDAPRAKPRAPKP